MLEKTKLSPVYLISTKIFSSQGCIFDTSLYENKINKIVNALQNPSHYEDPLSTAMFELFLNA